LPAGRRGASLGSLVERAGDEVDGLGGGGLDGHGDGRAEGCVRRAREAGFWDR